MLVAFYAPLKPIDHPVPSGDRRMGRLFVDALTRAGHRVEIACRLRSRVGDGDRGRQRRLADMGRAIARVLVQRYRRRPPNRRPQIWFTYHLYYKAADWIGPAVASSLAIPYVVAEASLAEKRAGGAWAEGHRATVAALSGASLVLAMSAVDEACLRSALAPSATLRRLSPFLDPTPFVAAAAERARSRDRFARSHGLDPSTPWLLAVGMMRPGDKLRSYRVLGAALTQLLNRRWRLIVVGDGPARAEVDQALRPVADRLAWLGAVPPETLPEIYAAADLKVWPALGEAYGMALLEAEATGVPVVAGRTGGVPDIVEDGRTGLLTPVGDVDAFAAAVASLLDDEARRHRMAAAAIAFVRDDRNIDLAANFFRREMPFAAAPPP
jgi:glycosyltransferase involved in cell wall biosynthesis